MGYQSSYQSAPRNRRQEYEDISGGSKMQTMEILSGGEYGQEFDESSSDAASNQRYLIYGCVCFLLLIIVIAPHDRSSDFQLPKNSSRSNNTTNATITTEENSSPVVPEDSVASVDGSCKVPASFQVDATTNFTYLNASNFCLAEDQLVSPDYGCHCLNPVIPVPNANYPAGTWNQTLQRNIELVNNAIAQPTQLDVVFLGDSITQHWNGYDGLEVSHTNVSMVFDQLFHKKNGSIMEGLALGIAGDRCPNLLYRLQHGEMPPALNPKVWWLLIGTNDLGIQNCNANAITVGNIRIVEEIRNQYPETPIVINSLLPREKPELRHSNPMWKVLQTVNSRLECYVHTHDNLHFFNATNLFIHNTTEGAYINETLMDDYVHPTGEGSMIWGKATIKKLEDIIARDMP